jgi:hypothetical protein
LLVLKQVQGTQFFFGRMWNGRVQNFPFHIFTLSPPWKRLPFLWSCSKIVSDLFQLPLSEEAFEEYCVLEILLQSLQVNHNSDQWKYIWGNGNFTVKKAYNHLIGSTHTHPAFRWLWGSSCQPKHKVFYWLLLRNRLNTRGLLRRKNMNLDSYDCEMCIRQLEKSLMHLFFRCSFAKTAWLQIGVAVPTWLRPDRATRHIKRSLGVPFAREIIILMCWCIWIARNDWLFNEVCLSYPKSKAK